VSHPSPFLLRSGLDSYSANVTLPSDPGFSAISPCDHRIPAPSVRPLCLLLSFPRLQRAPARRSLSSPMSLSARSSTFSDVPRHSDSSQSSSQFPLSVLQFSLSPRSQCSIKECSRHDDNQIPPFLSLSLSLKFPTPQLRALVPSFISTPASLT
jgi:hypothetical protein